MTDRYCGEWHNPDEDGIGDANCVREPHHDRNTPHSGLGGDPLWFDDDPTANLNDQTDDEWEVLPVVGDSAPVGRALMLTQQEWDDLEHIATLYQTVSGMGPVFPATERRLALAERIIEANQP